MGLIEIVIAGLCLNATCPGDEGRTQVSPIRQYITKLTEDLKTENLRITTLRNGELSGYVSFGNTTIGAGVAFDVIKMLQDKYQFKYTIVKPDENTFLGSRAAKGAKELLEIGKADLVAAFLPVITSFQNTIKYSSSFDTADWVVLMKRPKESATGSGLLAPFTTPVWILIILSLLVVGPIIYLLIYIQARLCKDDNNTVYPLPACFWFVYGALLKQGTSINPTTDSSRLLFSTWWLFITILTAFYTANLTAFLTLSKFTLPINEPSDIKRYNYDWVTNRANGIKDYITVENQQIHSGHIERLADKIGNGSNIPASDSIILKNYVTDRKMFIREKSVVDHVMYRDYIEKTRKGVEEVKRCTYVVAKFPIIAFPRAFAYSAHFKYKYLFDLTIQHLVESGIIQYKLYESLPDTKICPLDLGNKERRLRNTNLLLTYLIVAGGLAVAALIFVLELLINLLCKKSKTRKIRKHQNKGNRFSYQDNNNSNYNNNNNTYVKKISPPPPSYHTLFHPPFTYNNLYGQKKNINGREYWVVNNNKGGVKELIPLRNPSALLFQYSN